MARDAKEDFVAWLNDAFAMEKALEEVLERHVRDAEKDPDVHARIQRHIEETRQQAATVKECIERLGGTPSKGKEAFASFFGAAQGMMNKPLSDTMVKNAIADYAAEHFEIASYRALIVSARQLGEDEIASRLEGILAQEEDMARFLEEHLPGAVREHLSALASA